MRHTGESWTEVWTSSAGFGFATGAHQAMETRGRDALSNARLLEILRRNLVKEFTKLLNLFFLGLLAGKLDPGFVEHLLCSKDWHLGTEGECNGIGGSRTYFDARLEDEERVEHALLEGRDPHLGEWGANRGEHVAKQVVCEGPGRNNPLLRVCDCGGLDGADPDRQIPLSTRLAQEHDRIIGGHLHADTDNVKGLHASRVAPTVCSRAPVPLAAKWREAGRTAKQAP